MTGGLRAYARHRGCVLHAVQRAIASGRIQATADKKIDFEVADAAWSKSTDAAKAPAPVVVPEVVLPPLMGGELGQAPAALQRRPWGDEPLPQIERRPVREGSQSGALSEDNGFMFWKTRLTRLECLEREGKLVDLEHAVQAMETAGKLFGRSRDEVPTQLAPQLVGLTDLGEIERRVREAFRDADLRIVGEIRSQFPKFVPDAIAAA